MILVYFNSNKKSICKSKFLENHNKLMISKLLKGVIAQAVTVKKNTIVTMF